MEEVHIYCSKHWFSWGRGPWKHKFGGIFRDKDECMADIADSMPEEINMIFHDISGPGYRKEQ